MSGPGLIEWCVISFYFLYEIGSYEVNTFDISEREMRMLELLKFGANV